MNNKEQIQIDERIFDILEKKNKDIERLYVEVSYLKMRLSQYEDMSKYVSPDTIISTINQMYNSNFECWKEEYKKRQAAEWKS